MNILVTGGCGFIGSNFIKYILNKYPDYSITNLDSLTYSGSEQNLSDLKPDAKYNFIKGDIRNNKVVRLAMKNCDYVVNFAAESHVDNSIHSSEIFTETNTLGTHILLNVALNKDIKKFIQISTDEVYGSIKSGSNDELSPLKPNNPYSASKAGADHLVRSFFITHRFPAIVTRSSNNFGPFQYPEKIIPLFITNALEGKKLPVYGDGQNIREWTYVLDNCAGIDTALHKGKIGDTYNISSGYQITNYELTKALLKLMKKKVDYISFVKDRKGHDYRYSLHAEKIKRLGWKPMYTFESALAKTIDWYKKNGAWWKNKKK